MTDINITPPAPSATATPTPAPNTTADAAFARRAAIMGDKALTEKYRAGDVALNQEMRTLNMAIAAAPAGDKLGAVLAGTATPGRFETVTGSELGTSDLISSVNGLRGDGLADETIREIIQGTPVSPERHQEAERIRERLLRDREWLRAYREGSKDHAEQIHRVNAVLAAPIVETK